MDPELESIFAEALSVASDEQRTAYLDKACGSRSELRREVEALLRAYQAGAFLEQPPCQSVASTKESPPSDVSGQRIGPYVLLQKIGEGGMGTVYMAEQREPVTRRVALKVIKPGMDTHQVVARFEAERQALAMMDHPHIAMVLDVGATDAGRPYFVMELVRGTPITAFCDEQSFSTRERLELLIPVCQAIQHAHQKGIIHRDIKPSNVLVTMHDQRAVPKVIDFGVAKATQGRLTPKTLFTRFEQFIGTPSYMSPEQAQMSGLDIDTRTDVYALGVLAYELVTGTTPFDPQELLEGGFEEIRRRLREEEPPKPSSRVSTLDVDSQVAIAKSRQTDPKKLGVVLLGDLDWVIMKAMEKDRVRRYVTANEFSLDIRRFLDNEPVSAVAPRASYRLRKLVRRHRTVAAATLAIAVSVIVGAAVATWQAVRAHHYRGLVEEEFERFQGLHYASAMQAIGTGFELGDLTRVRQLLAQTRGYAHRGFEWKHWQLQMHDAVQTLRGHENWLRGVRFCPTDVSRMVTCGDDGTARVWDLSKPSNPLVIKHGSFVRTVDYSPDGLRIVTAGGAKGGAVQQQMGAVIWDARTGRELVAIPPHSLGDTYIASACFSPDGRQVVCGESAGVVRIYDASTGAMVSTLPEKHAADNSLGVWAVDWSSAGLIFSAAHKDPVARVWRAATGQLVHELPHEDQVNCGAFSHDGTRIVCGTHAYVAEVWSAASGQKLGITLRGHTLPIWGVEFSPDDAQIATVSFDQSARIWDADTGTLRRAFRGHTAGVWSCAWSPDGRRLATAGWDHDVKLWDLSARKETLVAGVKAQHVALLGDGDVAVVGAESTEQSPVSTDGVRLNVLRALGASTVSVMGVADDGNWVAVHDTQDSEVQVWSAESGELVAKLAIDVAVNAVAVSQSQQVVILGCMDKSLRIWSTATTRATRVPAAATPAHIDVARDSLRFVEINSATGISVRDLATGRIIRSFSPPTSGTDRVAISEGGDRVGACAWEQMAWIWDVSSGERRELRGHSARVRSIRFVEQDQRVLTASWDTTARLWDTNGRELLKLAAPGPPLEGLRDAYLSADGVRLLTVSEGPSVVKIRRWRAASDQQLERWQD